MKGNQPGSARRVPDWGSTGNGDAVLAIRLGAPKVARCMNVSKACSAPSVTMASGFTETDAGEG